MYKDDYGAMMQWLVLAALFHGVGDARAARAALRGLGAALCGNQIFNPTSMCAYATVSTQGLLLCFENSTRAIDSSKNQPNRRRCDRAREFSSLVRTTQPVVGFHTGAALTPFVARRPLATFDAATDAALRGLAGG